MQTDVRRSGELRGLIQKRNFDNRYDYIIWCLLTTNSPIQSAFLLAPRSSEEPFAPPSPPLPCLLPSTNHHHPLGVSIPPPPMLVMFIAFLVAVFALLCIRFPSVWSALMAIDEPSDHRELGLVVASRTFPYPFRIPHPTPSPCSPSHPSQHIAGNPFRESGPPACMAKLIMMRHKVRSSSPPLSPRSFHTHANLSLARLCR